MNVDESYMRDQHVSPDDDWNYVHNLMYAIANFLEEGKLQQAQTLSQKLTGARGELDSTLYPFSARDSISRLDPELPVALRTGDWARAAALSQASDPPAAQVNLRFLARELHSFAQAMQAAESGDVRAAQHSSTEFDAELWRMTQQMKDKQSAGKAAVTSTKSTPSGPPKVAVDSDAYIDPLLKTLSVMSLELRASILAAQKQTAEAKSTFDDAAREEKDLGYHEPPYYIRPVTETEAAALVAAGDFPGATAAYQKALVARPRSGFSLYGIALCAEKSGDSTAAAETYADFLRAWKDADPNLAQIAHARAFLADHPIAAGQK
jgi:tetratricopeptide (TPR) repeat protein